jgi:hypothetical protein
MSMATIEPPVNHHTVTLEELALAIKNSIEEDEMPDDQAIELAHRILNFFGHGERVVDNILEPIDRDPFYMLEDAGILTTEMEEITLYDGREWRIHYWLFRMERIRELIGERSISAEGSADSASVYDSLADDMWHRRRP